MLARGRTRASCLRESASTRSERSRAAHPVRSRVIGRGRQKLNAAPSAAHGRGMEIPGRKKGMETPPSMEAPLEIREEILDGENPCGE